MATIQAESPNRDPVAQCPLRDIRMRLCGLFDGEKFFSVI
jgi:hypothetical protein